MHKLSVTALVIAALALSSPAFAQTVTGAASGAASTAAGIAVGSSNVNAGVDANASAGGNAAASTGNGDGSASGGGNANGGASASAGTDTSASNGSTSASASGASSSSQQSCADTDQSGITTQAIDAASLDAVTTITVFSTSDCSGLANLAAIDPGAQSTLSGNSAVAKALVDAGYQGKEIVGYTLDGTSLSVFVKSDN